jgi:AcrR family transcriptional regulator
MENIYTKKQLEILHKTIEYISKNGIQSFSMSHIADELNIKKPSLYSHFVNKQEILKGVFDLYKSEMETFLKSLIDLKASKLTKIKMYFFKMCENIQNKPNYMHLVLFEFYQHRDIFKEDFNFLLCKILHVVESADEVDNYSDIKEDIDCNCIMMLLHGILHIYLKNKLLSDDFDVLSKADKCWDTMEKLLRK